MTSDQTFVIVGASLAGARAAETIALEDLAPSQEGATT
jgi:hypothetical protein